MVVCNGWLLRREWLLRLSSGRDWVFVWFSASHSEVLGRCSIVRGRSVTLNSQNSSSGRPVCPFPSDAGHELQSACHLHAEDEAVFPSSCSYDACPIEQRHVRHTKHPRSKLYHCCSSTKLFNRIPDGLSCATECTRIVNALSSVAQNLLPHDMRICVPAYLADHTMVFV